MHPVLARFLAPDAVLKVLQKRQKKKDALDEEEKLLADAADAFPEARDALLHVLEEEEAETHELEQTVLLLAIHAARLALEADAELAAAAREARAAIEKQGASGEHAHEMIAAILLEEAFGYEDEAQAFDREFVLASMQEIPQLADLTPERVHSLHDRFVTAGPKQDVREKVLAALLESAWGEGPAAVNPEHLDEAWQRISRGLRSTAAREERRALLEEAIELLRALELVSAIRETRLKQKLAELTA